MTRGGPTGVGSDPGSPTSISIIYRSRDSFAFGNHRLTLAPDPAGSGTGSASKMSSDPSDPLGSAKDEGTRRTGSASKSHRIRRIRLGLQRVGRPSAVAPHLKGHRIRRIRLGLRRVGRPSAVAPHRNCHPFHGLRLGWRTINMPGVRCATPSRKVLSGPDGYPAFAHTGVHKRSARQGAFGRGRQRPVSQTSDCTFEPATPWGCSSADLRALVGCRVGQNLLDDWAQNMFAVSRLSSGDSDSADLQAFVGCRIGQNFLDAWTKNMLVVSRLLDSADLGALVGSDSLFLRAGQRVCLRFSSSWLKEARACAPRVCQPWSKP